VATRQPVPVHQALHTADDALSTVNVDNPKGVQAAVELMGQARALAVPMFIGLARLIERAERTLVGQGDTSSMTPEERRTEARSLLKIAHGEIHVEDPHPTDARSD
jgi:hypothetical protein